MIGLNLSLWSAAISNGGIGPANTSLPSITGTTSAGQTLSCSTGTWTGFGPITYTYQWLRNGSQIAGATASTYIIVTADKLSEISCEVVASDSRGKTPALAPATGWVGNLLAAPNDFSNAAWNFLLSTYENAGQATQLIREATGTGVHRGRQQISKAASSIAYRAQFDVAAGLGCNWLRVACEDSTGSNGAIGNYNALTATVGNSYTSGTGFTVTKSTLSALANGSYRVVLEFTTNSDTALRFAVQMSRPNQDTISYAGDGVSGLYLRNFLLGAL